ncbi:MAG: hypothetical protein A4E73_01418 [Syntrophaceae bacterium PtaU1.Bin231]|jgi:hypothetical protein|nr:MAG: hypothetical protein A4E73_01418 [Syntrophaceae bacterium PtaU1.Bin231]HOG18656.1 hypothetical protein [Syntrophales bacterium]
MKNYEDESCYEFHEKDRADRCFLCAAENAKLFVVRHIETAKLAHLCRDCMGRSFSEYMLDNTRPWRGGPQGNRG